MLTMIDEAVDHLEEWSAPAVVKPVAQLVHGDAAFQVRRNQSSDADHLGPISGSLKDWTAWASAARVGPGVRAPSTAQNRSGCDR